MLFAALSFSFMSLAAFGGSLLAPNERQRRLSLLAPLTQAAVWAVGIFILRGMYSYNAIWEVAEAWTRYVLAIPAALLDARTQG